MSNNLVVIDTLVKKRSQMIDEMQKMKTRFKEEISEIESAIETLCGKRVWEMAPSDLYDDDTTDYIRQSQEEI